MTDQRSRDESALSRASISAASREGLSPSALGARIGHTIECTVAPLRTEHRPTFVIAPRAVDFDESAHDAFACETKRSDESVRAPIRGKNVGRDAMKLSLLKRVINQRGYRVAHESATLFAFAKPVSDVAIETRPLADSAETRDADHALVVECAHHHARATE